MQNPSRRREGFSTARFKILCAIDAARVILMPRCVAVQSVDCRGGTEQHAVSQIAEILTYLGAPRRRPHSHSVSNLHSSHIRRQSVRHNRETRAACQAAARIRRDWSGSTRPPTVCETAGTRRPRVRRSAGPRQRRTCHARQYGSPARVPLSTIEGIRRS
jgi:hypothetical protein